MFKLSAIASALLAIISSNYNAVAFTTPAPYKAMAKSSMARNMVDLDPTQCTSIMDAMSSTSNMLSNIPVAPPEDFVPSYSKASYYTILGLYVMSFPGIWSQIKRSTKAKIKRKTFISDGEAIDGGKDLRQQAGEIMACK